MMDGNHKNGKYQKKNSFRPRIDGKRHAKDGEPKINKNPQEK